MHIYTTLTRTGESGKAKDGPEEEEEGFLRARHNKRRENYAKSNSLMIFEHDTTSRSSCFFRGTLPYAFLSLALFEFGGVFASTLF